MSYWYGSQYSVRNDWYERLIADQLRMQKSACTSHDIFNCLKNISHNTDEIQRKIHRELKQFKQSREYYQTWGSAFHYHLKGTSHWERVEIFLIGGGANLSAAKDVFSEPWIKLTEGDYRLVRYAVGPLPTWMTSMMRYRGSLWKNGGSLRADKTIPVLQEYKLPMMHDQTPIPIRRELRSRRLIPKMKEASSYDDVRFDEVTLISCSKKYRETGSTPDFQRGWIWDDASVRCL